MLTYMCIHGHTCVYMYASTKHLVIFASNGYYRDLVSSKMCSRKSYTSLQVPITVGELAEDQGGPR